MDNNKKIHQHQSACICMRLFVDLLVSCCHPIYHKINDTSDTIKFNSWQNNEITSHALHLSVVGEFCICSSFHSFIGMVKMDSGTFKSIIIQMGIIILFNKMRNIDTHAHIRYINNFAFGWC